MDNPNPIYYKDLVTPDNAITDLISQLTQLISVYDGLRSKIQSDAAAMVASLKNLSGATEESRNAIADMNGKIQEMSQQYTTIIQVQKAATAEKKKLTDAEKEAQKIAKLIETVNKSAEGSYNQLSAQYRLNKIRLNEMSEAERYATKEGKALEAESKKIYERMNEMQKATGKAQLQVGHYERGLASAVGINGKFADALGGSVDVMGTARNALKSLASPFGAIIGILGGAVAAFKLFKDSVKETQITGDELQIEMAGWSNAWDLLKKSIATVDFTLFINSAKDAIRSGKELAAVLDEVFERTNSAKLQKAALSSENAALEEALKNTQLSYEERVSAGEQYLTNIEGIYAQEQTTRKRVRDAELHNLFTLTNARQFASEEERKAAEEAFAANIKNYNLNEDSIKEAQKVIAEETKMENNRAYLTNVRTTREAKALGEAIENSKRYIESASDEVNAAKEFLKQYNLTKDAQVSAYVEAEVAYQESLSAAYNENKRIVTQINSIKAAQVKEQQAQAKAAQKAREDAEKAEQKRIEDEKKAEEKARADAEKKRKEDDAFRLAKLRAELETINIQIQLTKDGTDEMLNLRLQAVEKQREIELEQNRQKVETLRQDEATINAKYDKIAKEEELNFHADLAMELLKQQQDWEQSEFDLLDKNERQKRIFRIEQEKKTLEEILRLNRQNGKELTKEQQETIKNNINALNQERERLGYNNLYELLGISISEEQQEVINDAIDRTIEGLNSFLDSFIEQKEAAIEAAKARIDSAQSALDAEIEARNNGYANNVVQAQKDLELQKRTAQRALEQKKAAQKAQLAIDTITQASSMITASANIWQSMSPIPIVGPALAVAALALMWGSFAASKIKAGQLINSETYGEGTVELLQGGSHASGHDIDMGTKPDGTRRRAEGGEYFAVINKRNSRKFGAIIPDIINSLNDGTFAEKYQRASEGMSGLAIAMAGSSTDVSSLERDVREIREQGALRRYTDGNGNVVEVYKNLKKTILKS